MLEVERWISARECECDPEAMSSSKVWNRRAISFCIEHGDGLLDSHCGKTAYAVGFCNYENTVEDVEDGVARIAYLCRTAKIGKL